MSRSFSDMMHIINDITASRPQRAEDNIGMTQRLLRHMGLDDAMRRLRFVHIAGTKGKGTCAAYTNVLLMAPTMRVGLFTSPHLIDIRERVLVDGRMLDAEVFAKYFFEAYDAHISLCGLGEGVPNHPANFFRLMFTTAICAFVKEGVHIAVMEVGIGGRIDTTNVIPSSVCGITSLGMDHMELLGDTIEEIALEKAGIMKCGVPCFAGPQLEHPVTRSALQRFSADVECPLMFVDACAIPPSWLPWPVLSIGGVHVVANSQIALMLARTVTHIPLSLPLTEDEIRALSSTTFAGRSQVISLGTTTIFLDGAHTPESIAAASTWFSAEMRARLPSKNVLLFYSTRDGATLFRAMQQAFQGEDVSLEKCIITAIRSPKLPSQNDEQLLRPLAQAWEARFPGTPCALCPMPFSSWRLLLEAVRCGVDDNVQVNLFVTGSFFIVGEVLGLLQARERP